MSANYNLKTKPHCSPTTMRAAREEQLSFTRDALALGYVPVEVRWRVGSTERSKSDARTTFCNNTVALRLKPEGSSEDTHHSIPGPSQITVSA